MSKLTRYQMYIDGEWVDAEDGKTFESMNPATGEVWSEVPEATAGDVDRAVKAAHRAFTEGEWARTTATERGRYLRKLADLLADNSELLGRTETIDTGKMLKETRWQAKYISEFFHYFAGCADKVHGDTMPIDKPDLCVFTMREPLAWWQRSCRGTRNSFWWPSRSARRLPQATPWCSKRPNTHPQRCLNSAR